MNSSHVRALARVFQTASDDIKTEEFKLKQSVQNHAGEWKGKARDKFDSALEEAGVLFQRYSDNLYNISRELESAANEVDRVREEIERQRELERLARLKAD